MSIIIEQFQKDRHFQGLAEAALSENPYRQKLRELCEIPNPYRTEPACRSGAAKDEFVPNPYRSDEKKIAPSSKSRRLNVFDIPNPYR